MPGNFVQTTRALDADRSWGGWIAALVIAAAVVAWIAWLTVARVPLYQTSLHARLEVVPAPSQVGAPLAGRVIAVDMRVDKRVRAGDVLVELDPGTLSVQLARARGQLAALGPELASLEREIAAETGAVTAGDAAGRAAVREQLSRVRAADLEVEHAEAELARLAKLAEGGAAATMEVDKARADLAQRRSAREALGHAADGLVASERERDAGRRGRTAELERQRAVVDGTLATARGEIARLELELEQHVIRAPVAGVLGSVAPLQRGAMVTAGAPLATVIPDGALQVIAEYPASAVGRLAAAQSAKLKLDGFPWTRWGTVSARVMRVASEVRDGGIRVELAIDPGAGMPLVHGMTGIVDVEVEEVSPATLLLRSVVDHSPDPS